MPPRGHRVAQTLRGHLKSAIPKVKQVKKDAKDNEDQVFIGLSVGIKVVSMLYVGQWAISKIQDGLDTLLSMPECEYEPVPGDPCDVLAMAFEDCIFGSGGNFSKCQSHLDTLNNCRRSKVSR